MGIIEPQQVFPSVINMEKTSQAAAVMAVCASILLAGMMIAYKPGMVTDATEFRVPTGVPPAVGLSSSIISATDTGTNPKTLSVSGTGVINVKANQATVSLGVYTEDKSASAAIDENASTMTTVIAALKQLGFTDDDMQTTTYTVYPNYNYDVRQVVGYQVTNVIQIKIKDLTKVGPTIDAATTAGANRVDSISFGITEETASAMRLQAYSAAIADAKAKSDVLTSGLGIHITGVQSVNESVYYPPIAYPSYDMTASGSKASTPVLSGNLSVTVTLNIVYLID